MRLLPIYPYVTMGSMANNDAVPEVGPYPRPILTHKEELFAAELKEIRLLLTKLLEATTPR